MENLTEKKEYQYYNYSDNCDKDILIYEGEYLNGKNIGKFKEFDESFGNLVFEGEIFG